MLSKNAKFLCLVSASFLVLVGCNGKTPKTAEKKSQIEKCSIGGESKSTETALFEINGRKISKNDLPADMQEAVYQNEYEAYSKNLAIYKEYAIRYYLAAKKGELKKGAPLPDFEELVSVAKVSDSKAKKFFEDNKHMVPAGMTYEMTKDRIVDFLKKMEMSKEIEEVFSKMRKDGAFKPLIVAPKAKKIDLDFKQFPTQGNTNSKINVIEISDYLCGYCQKAHGQVKELVKKYNDKISFTQINFSLRPDGLSGTYVKGGICARSQSEEKFWTYHDEAFKEASKPHEHKEGDDHGEDGRSKASIEKAVNVAKAAGLDLKEFEKCLRAENTKERLAKNNSMLANKGINGTPVFLVNGERVANGLEGLEEVIENLLSRR